MKFENLNQAMTYIRIFHHFYPIIRLYNTDSKEILFESNDTDIPHENTPFYTGHYEATLSVGGNEREPEIIITIPITINGQPCCLELIQSNPRGYDNSPAFSTVEKTSLQHMQELIITDSLTNLYNRRYIDEQVPVDLNRAFRNDKPVSFIYADIDLFKEVNDRYGHITGDYLLKEVAAIFLRHIRRKDGWVARYGGDEFLICLPEMKTATAIKIADRIRDKIEKSDFCLNNHVLKVTCSFGIQTVHSKGDINSVHQLVEMVDKKLYHAKKKGRNRIMA